MSKSPDSRNRLCGNCKHFVAGGLCKLVKGQIKAKDTCDLFEYGSPQPMDTITNPTHTKTSVNYRPGFMIETTSEEFAQKVIQMEHELISRGVPQEEAHRAVVAYFSEYEPPPTIPWPGPITGLDLAGRINPVIVPDTGVPLTNFEGLPDNVEPYPTPNISPYGIGSNSYRSNPTPDSNNIGSLANTYDILNPPYLGDNTNWAATASQRNSEPSMHGEHGFNVAKAIPEWQYPIEQSQTYPIKIPDIIIPPSGAISEAKPKKDWKKLLFKWGLLLGGLSGINHILKDYESSGKDGKVPTTPLEIFAEYEYHGHDSDDECSKFSGKRFNLLETHNRPIVPSENLGYTTVHPNCKCSWKVLPRFDKAPNTLTRKEESKIHSIENHIVNAAKNGTLHKIDKDGHLSDKTTSKNLLKELCSCMNVTLPEMSLSLSKTQISKKALKEAFSNLRSEFKWLTDDYIENARSLVKDTDGVLYVIRAAGETITNHMSEGEEYRRKLTAEELNAMTRTAIGKKMDINHEPELETDATILDADFDSYRKEIQMLVIEQDPQINHAIDDGKITAVSINGGMPRSESIEPCDHQCTSENCELCLVPKGVVLGELDDIAMTWVITDPNGMYWRGKFIPSAEPGIKFTRIEVL